MRSNSPDPAQQRRARFGSGLHLVLLTLPSNFREYERINGFLTKLQRLRNIRVNLLWPTSKRCSRSGNHEVCIDFSQAIDREGSATI